MEQYRFHRLASKLILQPVTGQLSYYAPQSHFAQRYATLNTNVTLFSRLLSVSKERDVDVQNVLSGGLCANPLDLFYPNGAMKHTAKSNLLNEIEIK